MHDCKKLHFYHNLITYHQFNWSCFSDEEPEKENKQQCLNEHDVSQNILLESDVALECICPFEYVSMFYFDGLSYVL